MIIEASIFSFSCFNLDRFSDQWYIGWGLGVGNDNNWLSESSISFFRNTEQEYFNAGVALNYFPNQVVNIKIGMKFSGVFSNDDGGFGGFGFVPYIAPSFGINRLKIGPVLNITAHQINEYSMKGYLTIHIGYYIFREN